MRKMITKYNLFCLTLLESLSKWDSLYTALQTGGLERKASSLIEGALKSHLADNNLVLRELRCDNGIVDYSLIDKKSVLKPRVKVQSIIEVKFNYAKQTKEIISRLKKGAEQILHYNESLQAKKGMLLYIIAAPEHNPLPKNDCDAGWRYWQEIGADEALTSAARLCTDSTIGKLIGSAKRGDLAIILIEVPLINAY
jgi:hypothetical protein